MGETLMAVSETSAGAGGAMGRVRTLERSRSSCLGNGLGNDDEGMGAVSQIIAVTAATGATCARLNSHKDTNSTLTAPASARAVMRTAWVLSFAGMRLQ
jgi:hypothetical protein